MTNHEYKSITREAYDKVASAYMQRDQTIVDETFEVKKALEKFASLLPEHGKVLDIGSGGGRDARFFLAHGFQVTGIDFSERMIEGAKSINSKIDYRVMDFEHLEFPPKEFDGIWANASLHHIPKANLKAVLEKIYNILKIGGIFFIKVKHGNQDGIRENQKFGKNLKRYFAFYQPEELAGLLESVGFVILNTEVMTRSEWLDMLAKKTGDKN